MVAVMSVAVTVLGLWALRKPQPRSLEQTTGSLQGVLLDHVEYLPEIYRAHEDYSVFLHNDTSATLIYRYAPGGCSPCYLDDLTLMREFRQTMDKDFTLALPAYPANDRNTRIQIAHETEGFNVRNIPADSLALPAGKGSDVRYFAVIDQHGRVGMVFFPVRGRNDLTRQYFKRVEKHFQELKIACTERSEAE